MTSHDIGAQVLCCPQCGFEYVKFQPVLLPNGDEPLSYRCEDGHTGYAAFRFTKGQTVLEPIEVKR